MDKYNFYNSDYSNSPYFKAANSSKIDFTVSFINSMYKQLQDYEKIIIELKDNLAEKKAVKEAREERDKAIEERKAMAAQLYYGITKDDIDKVDLWWAEHTKEEREEYDKKKRPLPKTFHRITYRLYPTELGIIKTAVCNCGKEMEIEELL